MTIEEFAARLGRVKKSGAGFEALCPAHEDRTPSLSVSDGEKGIVVHCHAGCTAEAIVSALGLQLRDLFHDPPATSSREIVRTYDYVDESGELLFQVVRYSPKGFAQRRPDGRGGWLWRLGNTRRVLYRLPEVAEAVGVAGRVFICEGEKDVHAIEKVGEVATCNPGGVGKWKDEYAESLRGAAQIMVVADKDEGGVTHARSVAASVRRVVEDVRVVQAVHGKDAAEHLAAGHTCAEFVPFDEEHVSAADDEHAADEDLASLLASLASFIRQYVVVTQAQVTALALWVLHTHAFDAADTSPYILVTSAEKRSGKTRLLEALELLVREPLPTANISDAALFRAVAGEGER